MATGTVAAGTLIHGMAIRVRGHGGHGGQGGHGGHGGDPLVQVALCDHRPSVTITGGHTGELIAAITRARPLMERRYVRIEQLSESIRVHAARARLIRVSIRVRADSDDRLG